jgi:hypothetical protein
MNADQEKAQGPDEESRWSLSQASDPKFSTYACFTVDCQIPDLHPQEFPNPCKLVRGIVQVFDQNIVVDNRLPAFHIHRLFCSHY